MSLKDGGPAFPAKTVERIFPKEAMVAAGLPDALAFAQGDHAGMTLRDYFAGQALGAMVQHYERGNEHEGVMRCYEWADAMLTERAKPEGTK